MGEFPIVAMLNSSLKHRFI